MFKIYYVISQFTKQVWLHMYHTLFYISNLVFLRRKNPFSCLDWKLSLVRTFLKSIYGCSESLVLKTTKFESLFPK